MRASASPWLTLALVASLAFAFVTALPASGADPATPPAAGGKLPFAASKGDSLTPEDENAVRSVLFDYLNSLKSRDYRRAGGHIDEPTFYALADTMVREATGDSLPEEPVRLMLFGVASRDSLRVRPVPQLFATLITASEAASPDAFGAIRQAAIDVLAVRRVGDHVVIAYQLTIPGAGPEGQALTHVTAETLRPTKRGWKIVFRR